MNRRGFLSGILATTVVAATPTAIADLSPQVDEAVLSGIVENKTFYVSRTLHVADVDVIIRNCKFVAMPELTGPMLFRDGGMNHISNCHFDTKNAPNMTCVIFLK